MVCRGFVKPLMQLYEIIFQDEDGNLYTTTNDFDHSNLCYISEEYIRNFTEEDATKLREMLLLHESQ